jgi:hypothetical protein
MAKDYDEFESIPLGLSEAYDRAIRTICGDMCDDILNSGGHIGSIDLDESESCTE